MKRGEVSLMHANRLIWRSRTGLGSLCDAITTSLVLSFSVSPSLKKKQQYLAIPIRWFVAGIR